MEVQGNEGASSSKLLPRSASSLSPALQSPSSWLQPDDEQRTLHGDSFDAEHNHPYGLASRVPQLGPLRYVEKGILRGSFAPPDPDQPLTGHNVAFLDLPTSVTSKEARGTLERSQTSPLVFARRPTLASARSSVSCSSCTCSPPFSPNTGDEVARSRNTRTPSLSRSETEYSEGGVSSTGHHQCPRGLPHGTASLLTAALLAGDVSPRKQIKMACGILRRDVHNISVFENDSDTGGGIQNTTRPRFVEPLRPSRSSSRQERSTSPTPARSRTSFSRSSQSHPTSPRSKPPHPILAPPCPLPEPSTLDEPAVLPSVAGRPQMVGKRRLTFQDAEGVEERVKARSAAARAPSETASGVVSSADESSTSRRTASGQSSPVSTPATTFDTRETLGHTISPNVGHIPFKTSDATTLPDSAVRKAKLSFAPSPTELVALGRSSTIRGRTRRGGVRALSDGGDPYVDDVAASSSSTTRRSIRTHVSLRAHRSLSPAPRRLGGLESSRSGGRTRSPAPRGRIAIPQSYASSGSDEPDPDQLDYDEDGEDGEDDSADEEEEEENSSEEGGDSDVGVEGGERSSSLECLAAVAGQEKSSRPDEMKSSGPTSRISRRGASSTSSTAGDRCTTYPALLSDFDFEEEGRQAAHDSANRDATGSPSYPSLSASSAASPLPFARSRLPSIAVSDAEASAAPKCRPHAHSRSVSVVSSSMSNLSPRPSISPVRAKSSTVISSRHSPSGPRSGSLVPTSSTHSTQREVGMSTSRSFSGVLRCAPSLSESSEQARGLPKVPPLPSQSPDAWTTLRSSLISALGDGRGTEGNQTRGLGITGDEPPRRISRSWLSALSTPGSQHHQPRSLATSPDSHSGTFALSPRVEAEANASGQGTREKMSSA